MKPLTSNKKSAKYYMQLHIRYLDVKLWKRLRKKVGYGMREFVAQARFSKS